MNKNPILSKKALSFTRIYLLVYSIFETIGFSVILFYTLYTYDSIHGWKKSHFETIVRLLKYFQTPALLEFVHAHLGLTKSDPAMVLLQVCSRVGILWFQLIPFEGARHYIGFPTIAIAWSCIEIIRNSYYGLYLLKYEFYILLWLRYSAFIILYPLGVYGELLILITGGCLELESQEWSLSMPNVYNLSFQFAYILLFNLVLYIPGLSALYYYSILQRRKAFKIFHLKRKELKIQ